MTENKRFTIEIIEDKDVFIQQKGAKHYLGINGYVNGGMVVDLLNTLNDENEEFKKALVELKEIGDYQEGRIKELSDENDQLQEELLQCKAVIDNRWSEYLKKKELKMNDE